MIRLIDLLKEVKTKEPLVNLFRNDDILDNGKLKNLLIHYIESQHNLQNNEFEYLVQSLLQSKSKYPSLQPKKGYAYRGSSITPEQFNAIKDYKVAEEKGYSIFKAPYTSTSNAQSWTYDFKVAQTFADKGLFNNPRLEKGGKAVIVRATINDEFIGSPGLTKPISDKLSLKNEKEIFHLGKTINNAEWMIANGDIMRLTGQI